MSPKTKAAAAHKKESKSEHKTEKVEKAEKPAKKAGKAGKEKDLEEEAPVSDVPAVDQDELEEAEDAAAAASSSGGSSNDAALAAASGSSEMSASFKNFRHHPDMENFYRFIFENDLRHEALSIIDEIMAEKLRRRTMKAGAGKSAGH
jgi:hypothetical protein